MTIEITEEIAAKVLATVDAGLSQGLGRPIPGEMCVEAAVCYALGQEHGDERASGSSPLRTFKIVLNDAHWSSRTTRARGLRRLALAQLGSAEHMNKVKFITELECPGKAWAARAAYTDADDADDAADAAEACAADVAAAAAR